MFAGNILSRTASRILKSPVYTHDNAIRQILVPLILTTDGQRFHLMCTALWCDNLELVQLQISCGNRM